MTLLIEVLKKPSIIANFNDGHWDILTCQARAAGLLGRLHFLFKQQSLLSKIPPYVIWHYQAVTQIMDRLKKNALREVDELSQILHSHNIKTTFLKGAAYQICSTACNEGRFMSDIDMLVDKSEINHVKGLLLQHGWLTTPMDEYDQHYYREWMHEIPPLRHVKRGTILDVHHNILPLTNKNSPLAVNLNTRIVNHEWCGDVNVLTPADTVIHSAVHLFTESEFHHALRDLSDLHMLICEFKEKNQGFITELAERANTLGLSRYIWLALTYSKQIFETDISNNAILKLNEPPKSDLRKRVLNFCYGQVFLPNHKSCRTWKMSVAEELLFWRSHLIKMPLRILIPHLIKKSYKQLKEHWKKVPQEENLP